MFVRRGGLSRKQRDQKRRPVAISLQLHFSVDDREVNDENDD
jgi:hypothetical protein